MASINADTVRNEQDALDVIKEELRQKLVQAFADANAKADATPSGQFNDLRALEASKKSFAKMAKLLDDGGELIVRLTDVSSNEALASCALPESVFAGLKDEPEDDIVLEVDFPGA